MKVLHIIDTLWLGGIQTLDRDYFEMQKDNPDVFLYVLRRSKPQMSINHNNVFVYDSYSRYSFGPIFRLKKLIKEQKIEILHCQLLRSHVFGYILKLLFFPRIKLLIDEQADLVDTAALSVPVLKLIGNKTNLFITCSNAFTKTLVEKIKIDTSKAITLYNGINLGKFERNQINWDRTSEREKLNITQDMLLVGFAGRLIKRKGWEEFIEVAGRLQNNNSIKFIIAGDGNDREELLTRISARKLSNVKYIGYVSDITWFCSLLDCLVVSSHHEPMGMIVVEGQAMRVPVIASNVDGLNEVATNGENALLFKSKDISDLELTLTKLLADKTLQEKLIEAGVENAKKYSIENYARSLADIYSRII